MIQEHEIRIGNFFQHNEQWSYRNEATLLGERPAFEFRWEARDWYALGECTLFLENVSPVPINSALLPKYGFEKCSCGGWKGPLHLDRFLVYESNTNIEYLHQLQNLVFAINGEELQITNMEYQIWMEGYAATGERSGAHLLGTKEAGTFDEAVDKYVAEDMQDSTKKLYERSQRYRQRDESGVMKTFTQHSVWGCRLFDNETDARKSFG